MPKKHKSVFQITISRLGITSHGSMKMTRSKLWILIGVMSLVVLYPTPSFADDSTSSTTSSTIPTTPLPTVHLIVRYQDQFVFNDTIPVPTSTVFTYHDSGSSVTTTTSTAQSGPSASRDTDGSVRSASGQGTREPLWALQIPFRCGPTRVPSAKPQAAVITPHSPPNSPPAVSAPPPRTPSAARGRPPCRSR